MPNPRFTSPEFRDSQEEREEQEQEENESPYVETVPLDLVIPCSSPLQRTQPLADSYPPPAPRSPTPIRSSSPIASMIEVPRSSPLQPARAPPPTKQGTLSMFFKPKPVAAVTTKTNPAKRTFDAIEISDDEDEAEDDRADIRRTQFVASSKDKPVSSAKKLKSLDFARLDISSYEYVAPSPKSSNSPGFKDAPQPPSRVNCPPALQSPEPTPITSSPEKPRPRRRLVRGLRPERSVSPDPVQEPIRLTTPLPVKKKLAPMYNVVSSDDELNDDDAFVGRESSPEIIGKSGNNIVDLLNAIEMSDLVALTGDKEDTLAYLTKQRPFKSIAQIKGISKKKTVRGKSQMVNIGADIVEKVSSFSRAINAVDMIVIESDRRAQLIKHEIECWGVDNVGKKTERSANKTRSGGLWRPGQPVGMNASLPMHDYQVFGVNWMNMLSRKGFGGILADDMGLGKTCQVIGLMCRLAQDYDEGIVDDMPFPNLIVVPPSTLDNWLAEFSKFAPDLVVTKYSGSQETRNLIVDDMLNDEEVHHVVLTSYTQLSSNLDIQNMNRLSIRNAIFDEGQVLKNPTTKQYQRLARLRVHWRLLLSGTPIQNHLMEMISLLSFVDPDLFAAHMEDIQYVFDHKIHSKNLSNTALLYGERVNRARSILEPFILQRLKHQVGQNLPEKTQRIVHCDLPLEQRKLYNKYEELFRNEGEQKGVAKKAGARENDMNNVWIQLKKAALHPQLFRQHFTDSMVHDMAKVLYNKVDHRELDLAESKFELLHNDMRSRSDFDLHLYCSDFPKYLKQYDIEVGSWKNSGKVQRLLEMIDEYRKNGDRALVFSKFSMVIDILSYTLNRDGIPHCQLTGQSAVGDRQAEINRFQKNADIPVFLLTTGAGGTGINLTAANKVIIFDMSSNPQDDKQAENRAHRLGQTRPVEVIHLIARNTVEELIYLTCQKKIELADKVITSGAGTGSAAANDAASELQLKNRVRDMMDQGFTTELDKA
ncbi:hypothetical protein TD95_005386 [Thielaviopsis punctulata]|uniref:Helicase C-terminal domain-containing protein n=1 Tax=Thielaviopsis punctulata TaxID=72032 RepID=A0A0F4ZB32_9PEZI|nr:hypothetical protein TD95_005386 [Thielaviopsis punctulata]